MLFVEDLAHEFQDGETYRRIFGGITFELSAGMSLSVAGPSGSGKTTLLQILGNEFQPTHGTVHLDSNTRVAYLPQKPAFVDFLTARENVQMAGEFAGTEMPGEKASALLDFFGIRVAESRTPDLMSGGEKQRLALARVMIVEPELVLADEPTASLDTTNARLIADCLARLCTECATAVVVATHDPLVESAMHHRIDLRAFS